MRGQKDLRPLKKEVKKERPVNAGRGVGSGKFGLGLDFLGSWRGVELLQSLEGGGGILTVTQ